MWFNLFVLAASYLFLPIEYVTMRNHTVCKNNLILSVTLPPEAQGDKEVLDYCDEFRKQYRRLFWILTAVLVPLVFLPWVSVVMTLALVWLLAAIVLMCWFYGKANKGLREIKRRRGWQTPSAGQTVVELQPGKLPKAVKTGWFVPPMILSVLPVVSCFVDRWNAAWKLTLAITAGSCLLVTAMSLLFYGLVFRQRADALDEDRDLTAALTRVRRYNWTKFWLLASWLTALYSLAAWCCQGNWNWYMVWTVAYSVVLLAAALLTEFAARRAQQRLTRGRTVNPQVDEDDHWIWGQFYYNPNNNRNFVNERVGMGMSMNLARPAGKALMGFSAAILLLMPLLGVWLMAEELSPMRLTLTEDAVVMEQAFTDYTVPLDQVEEANLISQLPPVYRTWGTGLDNLLKGDFSVEGYGNVKLCLNPNADQFLVLKTKDQTYIFSGDPELLKACAASIK